MDVDLASLQIELSILASSAQEDFNKKFWANYEKYLGQYNSILDKLHKVDLFRDISRIEEVPYGERAYMEVGFSDTEKAKLREIVNASRILEQKLKTKTQEIKQTSAYAEDPRKVFVIHGRDLKARNDIFNFLRSIDLHPIEWSEAVKATGKGSPYIGEILDTAFSQAQAVVVLITPDDEGRLRELFRKRDDPPYETELTPQARLNVIFEAGMAMGRNPNRTILVEFGPIRPFSDIGGRHVIRLDNTIKKRQELAQRLETAKCAVDLSGTDWHKVGDFTMRA
jgi:predicted nucleotide-binding protein